MTCTSPDCGGLVTWVSPYYGVVGHYRCQACGRPYKKDAVRMQEREVPKFAKEVKKMTGAEKTPTENTEYGSLDTIPKKVCTKCGDPKPATLEYFHKAAKGRYGVKPVCKKCLSKESKERWSGKKWNKEDRIYREKLNIVPKADPVILVQMDHKSLIAIFQAKIDRLQVAIEVIRETC